MIPMFSHLLSSSVLFVNKSLFMFCIKINLKFYKTYLDTVFHDEIHCSLSRENLSSEKAYLRKSPLLWSKSRNLIKIIRHIRSWMSNLIYRILTDFFVFPHNHHRWSCQTLLSPHFSLSKKEVISRCIFICNEIEKILLDLFFMCLELEFGEIPVFPDKIILDQMDFVDGPIIFSPMDSYDEFIDFCSAGFWWHIQYIFFFLLHSLSLLIALCD
jgi:hypothetical protein